MARPTTSDIENKSPADLSASEAAEELARLTAVISQANKDYHGDDAPVLSDAQFDALKQRNLAIEERFPDLKHIDSPSEKVGAAPSDGFGKIQHVINEC